MRCRAHTLTHTERRDRRWERVRGGQTEAQHAPQIGRGGTYGLPGTELGKQREGVHSVYGISYTKQLIRFMYLRRKFNFLCSEFVKYDDYDGQYNNNIYRETVCVCACKRDSRGSICMLYMYRDANRCRPLADVEMAA